MKINEKWKVEEIAETDHWTERKTYNVISESGKYIIGTEGLFQNESDDKNRAILFANSRELYLIVKSLFDGTSHKDVLNNAEQVLTSCNITDLT